MTGTSGADPNWQLSSVQPADVVMSPDGSKLYASCSDGNLRVYDVASGTLLATWDVGTNLGGIDISQDGSFLIAVDRQPVSQIIGQYWPDNKTTITTYKISTQTGAVTSYPVTVTGLDGPFFDVAVLSNGTALLSESFNGSGWTNLRILDTNTGQYTTTQYTEASSNNYNVTLTRSADGSLVAITSENISDAPVRIFKAGVGIVANHDLYADNISGFNSSIQAFSVEAGIVVQLMGSDLNVYNTQPNICSICTTYCLRSMGFRGLPSTRPGPTFTFSMQPPTASSRSR